MSELILVLGLTGFAAPQEAFDLARIWEREVLLGEVSKAAADYKLVYQDELTGRPLAVRRRAAFRAGLCFERLGQAENARYAYGWLAESETRGAAEAGGTQRLAVERPGSDAILVERARARLRDLPASDDSTLNVSTRTVRLSVKEPIGRWERELAGVNDDLIKTRDALSADGELASGVDRELRRLERRYGALGLQLEPSRGVRYRGARRGARVDDFVAQLFQRGVIPERIGSYATAALLAKYWYRRALLEAVAGRSGQADLLWELCEHVTSDPNETDALDAGDLTAVRERLQGLVGPQLTSAARRELLDTHLQDWTKTQQRLLQRLSNARFKVRDRQRADFALAQELFDVPELLDGVLSPVLEEPQVEAVLREARELVFLLGQGAIEEERLAVLWRERRRLRDEVLLAAAARLELAHRQLTDVVVVPLGVAADVNVLGQRELGQQVQVMSAALDRRDPFEGAVQLEVLRQLRGWFPVSDREGGYREREAPLARRLGQLQSVVAQEAQEGEATR